MRIRYARKPLKAKKHDRIRNVNENSLCPQTARKPKTLQNPKWECEFGMLDKQSKAKNTIESEVKMRIRYARKPLKAKKHDRIRNVNENSLCPQTARKPKTLQNPKWECEFGMLDKHSKAKNTIESEVKMRISVQNHSQN